MRTANRRLLPILSVPLLLLGVYACSDDPAPANQAPTPGPGADAQVDPKPQGDGAVADAADAGPVDTRTYFTAERVDEAAKAPATSVKAGQRERLALRWNIPGVSEVALEGAGELVAIERTGVPTWDDLTQVAGDVPTFAKALAIPLPAGFAPTVLGDKWQSFLAVNAYGVITRTDSADPSTLPGEAATINSGLPAVNFRQTEPSPWANGTLAPFWSKELAAVSKPEGTPTRLKSKVLGAGSADERVVIEWLDFAIRDAGAAAPRGEVTFQAALYKDGRVEFRYKELRLDPASDPVLAAPVVRGVNATIGLASANGKSVYPLSSRHGGLPEKPTTYAFYPANKLPSSGVGIVVLPKDAASLKYTLKAANVAPQTVDVEVAAAYTVATTFDATPVRDISAVAGVKEVSDTTFKFSVNIPIDFRLGVFGERWPSLTFAASGAIGPLGSAALRTTSVAKLGGIAAPNSFVAIGRPTTGDDWSYTGPMTVKYLVEGNAPDRKVSLLWQQVSAPSKTTKYDVLVVLGEAGGVELHYTKTTDGRSDAPFDTMLAGIENGNGDIAIASPRTVVPVDPDVPSPAVQSFLSTDETKPSTHIVFTRAK